MLNIIKIYTSFCVPCKMLIPVLEKLQAEFTGKISIQDVNVDEGIPELYADMNIMSTPTLLFIKDGVLLKKIVGLRSYESLKELITKLLEEK